ncbi:hypothetical protein B7P43_G14702, partial [Cryptotermes secundus]
VILPGVPSLLTLSSSHSFRFCTRPPKSHTLEYSWPSFLAPLLFMCSPSLPKSQSSIQLFGSTNVTPSDLATQSYLSDEITGDHQCGFRRNGSNTDQIFCIRQMLEKGCTVFARSEAGIVGSNPTQGMDVCVRFSVLVYR